MSVPKPFNFQKWLAENRELLKPPVANKNLTPESDDYIVMVGGAPLNEEFGIAVGADAYCRDAAEAATTAVRLVGERRSAAAG